jgi:hypothetical protein
VASLSSSARDLVKMVLPEAPEPPELPGLLELLARARLFVPANVAPCIPRALLLSPAVVRRWLDGPEWARGPVVRLVLAVCSVVLLLVRRLLEPLPALAPA